MSTRAPPADTQSRLARLAPYYLACLRAEANRGATALAGARPNWFAPPGPAWHAEGLRDTRWGAQHLPRRVLARVRGNGTGTVVPLFYGYPLLSRGADRAGESPTRVPVLLYPIELRAEGERVAAARTEDGPPLINADFLSAVAATPEERRHVARAVREAFADDPTLRRLGACLRDRADLHCDLQDEGIVVEGAVSTFTRGLEAELKTLAAAAPQIAQSALGALLGGPGTTAAPIPLIEPAPLDDAQRAVAGSATNRPFTVATGPAGTGKTQVVTAALASVLCAGGSVLFASRNHHAVNVIEARMAELVGRPVLMRAGLRADKRDPRRATVEALKTVLSGATPGAVRALKQARDAYAQAYRARTALQKKLDDLSERVAAGRRAHDAGPWTREQVDALLADTEALAEAGWLARRLRGLLDRPLRRRVQALRAAAVSTAALDAPPPERSPFNAPHAWCRYLRRARQLPLTRRARHRPGDLAGDFAESLSRCDTRVTAAARQVLDAHLRALASTVSGRTRTALGAYRASIEQGDARNGREIAGADRPGRFEALLRSLPLWSVTSLSAHSALPLAPGVFDLVIVDEASQSDIPSALPLLYRARRALIIGDANQLRHVATLRRGADRALRAAHGLTRFEDQPFGFVANSLFDAALTAPAARVHFLDGHYRGHAALIEYSNRQWYGGRLRVRTDYARLHPVRADEAPLRWVQASSAITRGRGGGVVMGGEVKAVKAQLMQLRATGFRGSIGVVAPFRAQVARLRRAIAELDPQWVADRALTAATAHGFQGDERDLIIVSLCVAESLPRGAKRFLEHNGNLLNVALTRARSACLLVGDRAACARSGIGHYEALAEHARRAEKAHGGRAGARVLRAYGAAEREAASVGPDEQTLIDALRAEGLRVVGQYPVDQYVVDLWVSDGTRELLVEIDGLTTHTDASGARLTQDLRRDARLRARGWTVMRVWAHQVRCGSSGIVTRILEALAPTRGTGVPGGAAASAPVGIGRSGAAPPGAAQPDAPGGSPLTVASGAKR